MGKARGEDLVEELGVTECRLVRARGDALQELGAEEEELGEHSARQHGERVVERCAGVVLSATALKVAANQALRADALVSTFFENSKRMRFTTVAILTRRSKAKIWSGRHEQVRQGEAQGRGSQR